MPLDASPELRSAASRLSGVACGFGGADRAAARRQRPPALMMALHVWSMSHGVAALFGRADGGRRPLPMSAAELLEAGMLIYLQGLGLGPEAARLKPSSSRISGVGSGFLPRDLDSRHSHIHLCKCDLHSRLLGEGSRCRSWRNWMSLEKEPGSPFLVIVFSTNQEIFYISSFLLKFHLLYCRLP